MKFFIIKIFKNDLFSHKIFKNISYNVLKKIFWLDNIERLRFETIKTKSLKWLKKDLVKTAPINNLKIFLNYFFLNDGQKYEKIIFEVFLRATIYFLLNLMQIPIH